MRWDEDENELKINIPGLSEPLQLVRQCWSCKGKQNVIKTTGEYPYDTEDGSCSECHGKGYCPTEAGEAIIEFVRKFM